VLKVLYLAAEVVPFVKTGGVADVAGSLPPAVRALGHDIRVAMPRYGRLNPDKLGLERVLDSVDAPMDERLESASVWRGFIGAGPGQTPVYFIDSPRYFDRPGLYLYPDDAERFVFFARAALEMCRALDWRPDVIHANEWHTALVPNWLQTTLRNDPFFADTASLYTAHNLEYQGVFGQRVLEIAGLADFGFIAHPEVAPDLNTVVDFAARGLLFADIINTVSETHAREILTPEYGQRLDPILRDRRDRLYGIVNGIDTELYDPATDANLSVRFDLNTLERRPQNKAALQRETGLDADPTAPLVGVVSRLLDQKGLDLILEIVEPLLTHLGCQLVVMGTGELRYHEAVSALAHRHPGRVSALLSFNRRVGQRIYGGSDIFLMPSRFEPCGLNQMIAMHYGCIPVVRATGGLADTVSDFRPETGEGNGFTFTDYDPWALYTALVRAVETYRHTEIWRRLIRRCMAQDFSWGTSARRYVDLYQRALTIRRASPRTPDEYARDRAEIAPARTAAEA
jgi:starch synthase